MPSSTDNPLQTGPLGQASEYPTEYAPGVLHPIPRSQARALIGFSAATQMYGVDLWNCYEFSWLNDRGLPQVAIVQLQVPIGSASIVESKSLKLYLNSFAQTRFADAAEVRSALDKDLANAFGAPITVVAQSIDEHALPVSVLAGKSLDELAVEIDTYEHDIGLLGTTKPDRTVNQSWSTNLFRSLCPVTSQPDWASLQIDYAGPEFEPAALLRYLVSYRNHQAFHEATIEQIYLEICSTYRPTALSVNGRFLRRGGIDINPFRSSREQAAPSARLVRQ